MVFGLTVTGYGAPIGRLHGISAHFLTVLLACAFVFCALVAAQCLLLVMFGRRAAQAASMTFQVLFAVGLVQLLFFLPELSRALRAGGTSSRRDRGAGGLSAGLVLRGLRTTGRNGDRRIQRRSPASRRE